MQVRTNINKSHLGRLALLGCFCAGMAIYCLYDGLVGYPNQRERANAFIQFVEENQELEEKEIADRWNALAIERGWPTGHPGEPRTDYQISQQFLMAGVVGVVGLFFLTQLVLCRGRWIEVNDSLLTSSRGDQLNLDQITELNKKKWQNKGIASVSYEADGRTKKLVLDDYNYDRDTTDQILRHIEANIDHSKIVNGKPEPPRNEEPAEITADSNA